MEAVNTIKKDKKQKFENKSAAADKFSKSIKCLTNKGEKYT
jgi:hypothetical protein